MYRYLLLCDRVTQQQADRPPEETVARPASSAASAPDGGSTAVQAEPTQTQPGLASERGGLIVGDGAEFVSSQRLILWDDWLHYLGFALLILIPAIVLILWIRSAKQKRKRE